jgi:integrase
MTTVRHAIDAFSEKFLFRDDAKGTRRVYLCALQAWAESLASIDHPPEKFQLSELGIDCITQFERWMQSAINETPALVSKNKSTTRFKPDTIRSYAAILLRALNYWRSQGWISFSAGEEREHRKAGGISSRAKRRTENTRAERVPEDFGERMVRTVLSLPLPPPEQSLEHLDSLRLRALVLVLTASALRISDVCRLRTRHIALASPNTTIPIRTKKTGTAAQVTFSQDILDSIQLYLKERGDSKRWLFISHGKGRLKKTDAEKHPRIRKGYGNPLHPASAYNLIAELACLAYPDPEDFFLGPHAFRHWHAQQLRSASVPMDQIQAVLGHSSSVTTEMIYAPEANAALWKIAIHHLILFNSGSFYLVYTPE